MITCCRCPGFVGSLILKVEMDGDGRSETKINTTKQINTMKHIEYIFDYFAPTPGHSTMSLVIFRDTPTLEFNAFILYLNFVSSVFEVTISMHIPPSNKLENHTMI